VAALGSGPGGHVHPAAGADGGPGWDAHDHSADGADGGPVHDHSVDGEDGGPGSGAGGHGAGPAGGAAAHDHGGAAAGEAAADGGPGHAGGDAAGGGHTHSGATGAGGRDHSGPTGGDGGGPGGGPAAGGDHHPEPPAGAPPSGAAPPDAPQGTWADLRYGPFVIPPAGAGGDARHADIAVPSLAKPCTNCFLLQLQPDLVYADGRSANLDTGMMLHHAVLFSAGRPDATCGPGEPFPGKLGQRFFASGNERTPGLFPPGFGYYVDGGNWSGIFHVMNHGTEARTVWFRLRVRWSPAAAGGVLPLTPIWLDMNNCRTSEYAVPAGPSSSHWTWTSTLTGRVISTGGHVHNGGVRTTLSNKTTGQHLCTSWAGWGKNPAYQGSIESMSVCSWDRVGTVQKGQVLDLESVYDAPQAVPDAMGIMMAFVYETTDLAAGTEAPPSVRGEGPPPVESTPPPSSSHDHH
jgi:hypothetical protein